MDDLPLEGGPGALYRSLPREEPPPTIDAAVLAAARGSVETNPARRWAAPAALAAVLVLSVGVTLRVADEKPDAQLQPTSPSSAAPVKEQSVQRPAEASRANIPEVPQSEPAAVLDAQPAAKPKPAAPAPERRAQRDKQAAAAPATADQPPISFVPSPRADSAQPPSSPASSAPGVAAAPELQERSVARSEARSAAPSAPAAVASDARTQMQSKAAPEANLAAATAQTPEAWLERIARMRAQGRHKEADESYAEFRRQHPGYVLAPEMLQKIAPLR